MKTNLFKRLPLAAAVVAAGFAGCTNEDILEKVQPGHEDNTESGAVALFSTGDDTPANAPGIGTKTTMDANGVFQWTAGDVIWVKNAQGQWIMSSNSAHGTTPRHTFVVPGSWTEESYPVLYVGQYNRPRLFEIRDAQFQENPNQALSLGEYGDYGYATATRQPSGIYKFDIDHFAAYLSISPLHSFPGVTEAKLKRVRIESNNYLCGTYNLTEAPTTLANPPSVSSVPEQKMIVGYPQNELTTYSTLWSIPSTDEFDNGTASYDDTRLFLVIKPGQHQLTFYYDFEANGIPWTVKKTTSPTAIPAGKFFNVHHILTDDEATIDTLGLAGRYVGFWDRQLHFPVYHLPYHGWQWDEPLSGTQLPNNNWAIGVPASQSAAMMPNANELYWYIKNGDAHLDTAQIHVLGTNRCEVGGVWLLKKSVIQSQGRTFRDDRGLDGKDHRLENIPYEQAITKRGRPSNYNSYFFLPIRSTSPYLFKQTPSNAIPCSSTDTYIYEGHSRPLQNFGFWSSTPMWTQGNEKGAYALFLYSDKMVLTVEPIIRNSPATWAGEGIFQ